MSEHKFNFVTDYPKIKTIKDAKTWICTNDPDFKPDNTILSLPLRDSHTILDFGCGIGRNIGTLVSLSPATIVAYDHSNMTDLAKQYLSPYELGRVVFLNPPISEITISRYDLVISTLVFMHMRESELLTVLPVIAHCLTDNGLMYVHCRGWTDDRGVLCWPLILKHFKPVKIFTPHPNLMKLEKYDEPKVLLRAIK